MVDQPEVVWERGGEDLKEGRGVQEKGGEGRQKVRKERDWVSM